MITPLTSDRPKSRTSRRAELLAGAQASKRLVISWMGWGFHQMELFKESELSGWVIDANELAKARGWQIERMGGNLDLILGKRDGSITRYEFYRFQKEFDKLNERYGFWLSGMLWLMEDGVYSVSDMPCEIYVMGRTTQGDSIGRPARHNLNRKNSIGHKC